MVGRLAQRLRRRKRRRSPSCFGQSSASVMICKRGCHVSQQCQRSIVMLNIKMISSVCSLWFIFFRVLFLQICSSSQTSQAAGLPVDFSTNSARPAHAETGGGRPTCMQNQTMLRYADIWGCAENQCLTWAFVCRSQSVRAWRQTQALWWLCVRRLITTFAPASTHYRCVAALRRKCCLCHEQLVAHFVMISQCFFLPVQFLHGRGVKQLDTKTIQRVSVGQKDQNKGLFYLWQEIFQLPRAKRYKMV